MSTVDIKCESLDINGLEECIHFGLIVDPGEIASPMRKPCGALKDGDWPAREGMAGGKAGPYVRGRHHDRVFVWQTDLRCRAVETGFPLTLTLSPEGRGNAG